MKTVFSKFNLLGVGVLLLLALAATGCKKGCTDPLATNFDPDAKSNDNSCIYDNGYEIPIAYSFENVDYGGQTARILLLKDLEAKIEEATAPGTVTAAELSNIFTNSAGSYQDIGGSVKTLEEKFLATTVNAGIRQQWLDSLNTWFAQIETLSASDTYIREDGTDLKQIVGKVCMGAIFYDQAVNHYLELVANDDNTVATPGRGTDMEHHWDEAFGYWGAARDIATYTDAEIISPGESDANADGSIDPTSEKCFYYAQTAAKRDVGAAGLSAASQTDFTGSLINDFLAGRAAISNIDYAARDQAKTEIEAEWEKTLAATVIHYINETKTDAPNSADLSKHWSEAMGYFRMLTFNPESLIQSNVSTLQGYLGNYPGEATETDLNNAAETIGNIYGFTTEQIANW